MAVVPFKRKRRRLSIRYYLITDEGPVRVPLRLSHDLDTLAIPKFANSIQRIVEVLVEKKAGKICSVNFRPTSTRFDNEGKVDLNDAVEIMAEIVDGAEPKRISDKVLDISPTLRTRARERASWRISPAVRRLILADVRRQAKLPVFRPVVQTRSQRLTRN